ncbi:hypothetical protein DFJ77DRAFT_456334 [Powellomyces hirtus]|nr:hypothetical protein DFJ77DRAFT_456334 [Powellomyces hirtus]
MLTISSRANPPKVGIYIARYWKDSGSWVSYHQMLMGAVTTEIVFSALLGVIGEFGPIHRRHSILGLFLTGLIIIVTWLGRFSGYWDTEFSVKYNKYIRLAHWTLGYSAYFTGLFQGYMGVVDITEGGNVDWLKWFYIPSVLATPLTLIMVAWWHNFSARKTDGKSTCKQSDNLPKFNWHDVHERVETGAKLLVIKGIVYDAAPFMLKHPGGAKILGSVVGMDATNAFYGIKTRKSKNKQDAQNQAAVPVWHPHSRLAESLLSKLAVGALADDDDNDGDNQGHYGLVKSASMATDGDLESTTDAPTRKAQRLAQLRAISRDHLENKTFKPESLTTQLSELSYQNVELNTRTLASSTESKRPTYRISFKLNSATPEDKKKKEAAQDKANAATVPEVFLFPGQCVILQFITDQGEVVTRQYTPYKSRNVGTIDLYVKMANGLMTRHLKECQSIRIRGPFSHAPEAVNTERKNGCWDAIGMICGGSGLTPMLLIIDYHLRFAARGSPNGRPALQMSLLNINHSDVDMFAQQDLEAAEQRSHGTLSVLNLCHEVKYPAKFKGQQGRVTAELLKKVLPPPSIAPNAGNAGGAPTPAMNASMPGYNRIQSLQMAAGSEGLKGMNRKRAVSPGSATAGDGGFAGFKTSSAMQVKQTPSQQQVAGKRSSAPYAELNQSVSQLFVEVPTTTPRTTTAVERRTSSTGRYNPLPPSDSDESAEDPERQKAMSIFVCGPPPMQAAVLELLLALGYNPDSIVIL